MTTIASSVREAAHLIAPMLRYEPGIAINLRDADLTIALALIYSLIEKGVRTADTIASYLLKRELKYDRDTIQFLLNSYDGRDRRHSLWTRDKTGRYSLLD